MKINIDVLNTNNKRLHVANLTSSIRTLEMLRASRKHGTINRGKKKKEKKEKERIEQYLILYYTPYILNNSM